MRAVTLGRHADVASVLHVTHGCPEGCLACRLLREDEDEERPALLSPWQEYVASDAAMRHARNTVERGMRFPTLTNDELVQYVVQESVLDRYAVEQQKHGERTQVEREHAAKVEEVKQRLAAG